MLKRTPLYQAHQKLNARLVEFGGWEMPVQYTSIVDEHQTVRSAAGLFDISHMGEIRVAGQGALAFLNGLLTNDAARLQPGQGQYTLMCNERGGVIDDLYLYRLDALEYLLIVNASRIPEDFAWIEKQHRALPEGADVTLENQSDKTAAVAIQGPNVARFIAECFSGHSNGGMSVASITDLKKNEIARFDGKSGQVWAGRTGYTGEDGFEIIAPAERIEAIWDELLKAGQPHGLKPAGLGARDTLRTEMCYPLYGHELDENTSPIEAGVGFFVALEKGDFIGRDALLAQKKNGPKKKCVAFKMTEKSAPPRPHYPILNSAGEKIGEAVSGTQSPSLGIGIGMGYVPPEFAKAGTAIQIEIRGKGFKAETVSKPILKRGAS